jgi:dienelactone hydrolase
MALSFPVAITDCATLEANTVENPSWLGPTLDLDMVYRYPGVPTSGSWSGTYRDLMAFRDATDIDAARAELRTRIWQSTGMVTGTYDRLSTVGDHDEYEVDMPYWRTTSRCWLYRATVSRTGTLLIVHGGHDNHGPEHAALIPIRQEALAAGHDVLVVSMPGQSVNAAPGPYPHDGVFNGVVASHQNLPLWNRRYLNHTFVNVAFGVPPESAYHAFLAPVHRMINALAGDYDRVAMTGLSGGASTTLKCAALDPRIAAAYAVAGGGCVPRFAYYQTPGDFGDNEDQDRTWLEVANEEETLTMIASGGRRALVVIGDNDPVAFANVDVSLFKAAAEYEAAFLANGRLSIYLDDNNAHSWSSNVRGLILADLATLATEPGPVDRAFQSSVGVARFLTASRGYSRALAAAATE